MQTQRSGLNLTCGSSDRDPYTPMHLGARWGWVGTIRATILRTFAIFFKSSLLPKIAIRDGTGAATSRRFALPTKIWKTTPCKVADSCWHDAVSDSAKTFDVS